jgi:valyl-tRNA synthetase
MRPGNPEALQQTYDPARIESRWYAEWESRGVFKPRESSSGSASSRQPFVIMIPPPNVTGSLTMGHMLGESLRDLIVRWQRMEGRETLWVPGMDHAGIATQNVVEKALREKGKSRQELGREAFLGEVWAWKEQYGGLILQQLRRLGISADWSRERFTLDPEYSRAVLLVFQKLYEKGLIYRGHRIVNWCPRCQTALSDEEVEHVETEAIYGPFATRCATRSKAARRTSWWPPRGPRPCLETPGSRCIPATGATRSGSARPRCSRS